MSIIIGWILNALVVLVVSYLLPGITVRSFWIALVVAAVLGIINAVLKPILLAITLPINILTLGLFTLVINALLVLLANALVPGFEVDGFWIALLFSIVVGILNALIDKVFS